MKNFFLLAQQRNGRRFLIFLGTCLLFFSATPQSAFVCDSSGSSVDGSFRISSHDDADRYIEFHAIRSVDGQVSGETIFRDGAVRANPAEGADSKEAQTFFFKADVDCLVINKGTAVMSGSITDSNSRPYI